MKPELCAVATELLGHLVDGRTVLEVGAGHSTRFISMRALQVTSIEHDTYWFDKVKGWNLPNVKLIKVERDAIGAAVGTLHGTAFDVAYVDCYQHQRRLAIDAILEKSRVREWLVVDDGHFPGIGPDDLGLDWDHARIVGYKTHLGTGNWVKAITDIYRRP